MLSGKIVRFCGTILIIGISFGSMYAMLNFLPIPLFKDLVVVSWMNPCILACLIGFIISEPYMSVFDIATETIMVCLMFDFDMERPKEERPLIFEYFINNGSKRPKHSHDTKYDYLRSEKPVVPVDDS